MAFFSKVGSILKQTASRQINSELSASRPSIYQAIRCMSSSKLFIGGLSYSTDDQSLREAFSKYGQVVESRVILDRETGRSRGFGFVTFSSMEEASSAIQAMDGQDLHGRYVRVNYATDKRGGSSGYGRGGGGYGSGGSGYGGGGYGNNSYSGGGGYGGGGYGNNSGPGSGGYGGNYGGNYGNAGYGNNSHGGNVSSGGAGDFFGGNSGGYGSSSGNFGVAAGGSGTDGGYDGNVLDGNTFESGNSGGLSSGNFSVAGGGGGTDGGYDENTGSDSNQIGNVDGAAAGGFNEDVTLDGNYQDRGEDADDFAKRA